MRFAASISEKITKQIAEIQGYGITAAVQSANAI